MMNLSSVLITGTSRGLGLQFVKEFARLPEPPKHLIAACRHKSPELLTLAADCPFVHVLKLDVIDDRQYSTFVDEVRSIVGDSGINLLINNAGICDKKINSLEDVTKENMLSHLETNVVAPVLLTKTLLPLLQQAVINSKTVGHSTAAAILNVSSMMGCSHHTRGMPVWMPYRVSKAAQNKATHCLSFELEPEEIAVVAINPGWVRTEMGTKDAPIEVEDSVRQMMSNVVLKLAKSHSGKLFNYDGTEIAFQSPSVNSNL